jgi:hypothetical protein
MEDSFEFSFDTDSFKYSGISIDINDEGGDFFSYPGLVIMGPDRGDDLGHEIFGTIKLESRAAIELARAGLELLEKAMEMDEQLIAKAI